jgi:hypothetical protein
VLGIGAATDIPKNKVIMAIPNNLIITVHLVEKSVLKEIFSKHPQSFDGLFLIFDF